MRRLAVEDGIFAGISSGETLAATIYVAEKLGTGKIIVTIFPDGGAKYISTALFSS
jgi:cysteine synthase A